MKLCSNLVIVFSVLTLLTASWMISGCTGEVGDPVSYQAGDPCDSEAFSPTCDNNYWVECKNGKILKNDCEASVCSEFSTNDAIICDPEGEQDCTAQQEKQKSWITCANPTDKCNKAGDVTQRCVKAASGMTWVRDYRCAETKSGDLYYYQTKSTKCHDGYGVCGDNNECMPPIPCEDNEKHCEGNVLHSCVNKRLLISDCANYSKPRVCTTINNKVSCIDEKSACLVEGETIVKSCNSQSNKELLSSCMRAENGKLYYVSDGSRACPNGCNADETACAEEKCTKLDQTKIKCRRSGDAYWSDTYTCTQVGEETVYKLTQTDACIEGDVCNELKGCVPALPCNVSEFDSRCENDVAIICVKSLESRNPCYSNAKSSECAVIKNFPRCHYLEDICMNEGETVPKSCNPKTSKLTQQTCTRAENGKLYYVSGDTVTCMNGCNEAQSDCAN